MPLLRLRLRLQLADRGFVWAQAWAATEEVTLVIEACGSRCNLPDVPAGGSTFQRVADGGIGSHVVLGPTFNAAAAQAADLGGVQIELSVNGEVKVNTRPLADDLSRWAASSHGGCPAAFQVNGSGAAVFENPVNSLVFLAEELGKFGHTLKAGGKTAIRLASCRPCRLSLTSHDPFQTLSSRARRASCRRRTMRRATSCRRSLSGLGRSPSTPAATPSSE